MLPLSKFSFQVSQISLSSFQNITKPAIILDTDHCNANIISIFEVEMSILHPRLYFFVEKFRLIDVQKFGPLLESEKN